MTKEELEDIQRRGINVDDIDIQADIAYQLTRIADYMDIACMAGWLDFNNKKEVPDDSTSRT